MSDYGDDYDDTAADWIYVEDYYDDADALAEYTCASPPYFQEYEVDDISDLYDYFADLEYMSDGGYFDSKKQSERPSKRRKTISLSKMKSKHGGKGAKSTLTSSPPVLWISNHERNKLCGSSNLPSRDTLRTFALLKDWHQEFEHNRGFEPLQKKHHRIAESEPLSDEDEIESESIQGDGFDLNDLQQIAELISGDNLDALKQMMTSRGLDPSAVQEVLQDMITGKERDFSEDGHGEDDEAPAVHMGDSQQHERPEDVGTLPPSSTQEMANSGRALSDQPVSRQNQKKHSRGDETTDDCDDAHQGYPRARGKRQKTVLEPKQPMTQSIADVSDTSATKRPLRRTRRSGLKR